MFIVLSIIIIDENQGVEIDFIISLWTRYQVNKNIDQIFCFLFYLNDGMNLEILYEQGVILQYVRWGYSTIALN